MVMLLLHISLGLLLEGVSVLLADGFFSILSTHVKLSVLLR